MRVIVDTNVPVVANYRSSHATAECILACVRRLALIQSEQIVVLDDQRFILREYMRQLRSEGQPGLGDGFLKWVLTNQANSQRCEIVPITPRTANQDDGELAEFPKVPELATFDPADKKFVAVALTHPLHPPILNAVDTDWELFKDVLAREGVTVQFLCGKLKTKRQE